MLKLDKFNVYIWSGFEANVFGIFYYSCINSKRWAGQLFLLKYYRSLSLLKGSLVSHCKEKLLFLPFSVRFWTILIILHNISFSKTLIFFHHQICFSCCNLNALYCWLNKGYKEQHIGTYNKLLHHYIAFYIYHYWEQMSILALWAILHTCLVIFLFTKVDFSYKNTRR